MSLKSPAGSNRGQDLTFTELFWSGCGTEASLEARAQNHRELALPAVAIWNAVQFPSVDLGPKRATAGIGVGFPTLGETGPRGRKADISNERSAPSGRAREALVARRDDYNAIRPHSGIRSVLPASEIDAQPAQPIDGTFAADQRRSLAVADHCVVFDA